MPEKARVLLRINGRVQGVFFRLRAKEEADKLGLTGWIKNNGDGSVECLAEGEKDKLVQFIEWCNQGSEAAKVEKVEVNWQPYSAEFSGFKII